MGILNKRYHHRSQLYTALLFIKREGRVTQDKEIKPLEENINPKSLIGKSKREEEEEGQGKEGGDSFEEAKIRSVGVSRV